MGLANKNGIHDETGVLLCLWKAEWALLCQLFRNKFPSNRRVPEIQQHTLLGNSHSAKVLVIDILWVRK